MIIYRPIRSTLIESMLEAREFNNEEEMKAFIVKDWGDYIISNDDIVIDKEIIFDNRIGWEDCRHVLTKRFGRENNIKEYGSSQCIGICATKYKRK